MNDSQIGTGAVMSNAAAASNPGRVGRVLGKLREKGVAYTLVHGVRHVLYRTKLRISDYYRNNYSVPRRARAAIARVQASGRRGLFLDCGSNVGQGFDYFRSHFRSEFFDYELFEPNPNCLPYLEQARDRLKDHRIAIHIAAISTQDGWLNFYGLAEEEGGELSQGGSVLKQHNSSFYDSREDASLRVRAIDFPEFVRDKAGTYSVIVVKMDIEGGEYDVLEGLIERDMLGHVHLIFCEFHSQYMEPDQRREFRLRERRIEQAIRQTPCNFVLWR